ncbi:MAG: enoyl-CoA hydratase/isomerase family protein [Rhizobiales bacterium]|jgi:enoyl-CoA hydratase/carnithine racemase|nr:enoyl-CoA hydratase/isomerase family protein [Hyphomicrobiales bacterium]
MQDHVTVETDGGVEWIRFDRAEHGNAFTAEMFEMAADALSVAERDSRARAILITGMPGVFTSGHDVEELRRYADEGAIGASAIRFAKTVATVDKPIVAGIDGLAVGVGTLLLLHCDFVVASEWSIFSAPYADAGVPPEGGASLLAPRLLGYHRAFELLVMGEQFDAHRAREAGLVNRVVPAEDVDTAALGFAHALAAKPPEAIRSARRLMRGDMREVAQRIDQEATAFTDLLRSPAARDALQAYIERKN